MTDLENKPLLLRFHQPGGHLAAKRSTLAQCAQIMGVSETRAAHIAINRLWLQLTDKADLEFDFPANLPVYKPTKAERASTKKALDAFFAANLPNG